MTTQEQLKARVTDTVRQEQLITKLHTENTAAREQAQHLESECDEYKQMVDR